MIFVACLIFSVFTVSSAFYVMEDGERKKVTAADQTQSNAGPQSSVSGSEENSSNRSSSPNGSNFVDITGDTLQGALDMSGFGMTGLPSPDRPSDAATKGYVDEQSNPTPVNVSPNLEEYATEDYVDSRISPNSSVDLSSYATEEFVEKSISGLENSGNTSPSTLSETLSRGNVVDRRLLFPDGLMFGEDSEAVENSFAVGRNAEASAGNSFALGENSEVNSSNTFSVGSEKKPVNVEVSGNLSVDGEIGIKKDKEVWTYSFAADSKGTEVMVPDSVGEGYAVSVTPVDSLADVGVFNKTEEKFYVKASEFTQVDVILKKLSQS
jgi:hypothetical protein